MNDNGPSARSIRAPIVCGLLEWLIACMLYRGFMPTLSLFLALGVAIVTISLPKIMHNTDDMTPKPKNGTMTIYMRDNDIHAEIRYNGTASGLTRGIEHGIIAAYKAIEKCLGAGVAGIYWEDLRNWIAETDPEKVEKVMVDIK